MQDTVENIVFDVGRVLVHFSYDPFAEFLGRHGASISSREEFIEKTHLLQYEAGTLSTDQFLENALRLLTSPPKREILARHWQQIFEPIDAMLSLLTELSPRYRLFLMSNTNELHWRFLAEEYRLTELVEGTITSFEAKAMKPQPEIFHYAAARFNLQPARTLLIDDIAQHIEAARAFGWLGIQHLDPDTTRRELRSLGIALSE